MDMKRNPPLPPHKGKTPFLCTIAACLLMVLTHLLAGCGGENGAAESVQEAPELYGEVGDKWSLWSQGTMLRGANIYQRRVYPELDGTEFLGPGPLGPPYTRDDIDTLAAWGANYVQLSHPGLFTEDPPYVLDEQVQDSLDRFLEMIRETGMYAVIAFRTGPGRSEFTFHWDESGTWFDASYLNDAVWHDRAAQDAWVSMWRYTAERYGGDPAVVGYELMVEPNANDRLLDIWDPADFYRQYSGTLYDWNQLFPRITSSVREVDPETPILVGGAGYSSVDWLPCIEPSQDDRTVYVVHQYEPRIYTHQGPEELTAVYPGRFDADGDGSIDVVDREWLDALLEKVDAFQDEHHVPVAVSEFGAKRWEPGMALFMSDSMDLFEARDMNYALWAWEPSWPPMSTRYDDFNLRHGTDPGNHTDVRSSELSAVIREYWGCNGGPAPRARPSRDSQPEPD